MAGYAVLTGDIVDSSNMPAGTLEDVMAALEAATRQMASWDGTRLAGFARRGGDGWQIVLEGAHLSLRAALYLQANLRRLSADHATRIAIAETEEPLTQAATDDPNTGHGPAFTASGRLLTQLGRNALMAHADGGSTAAAVRLSDEISRSWTQAQARTLCEALPPGAGTRKEIATRLGISREAVNQALWSSGYLAIRDALEFVEQNG